MQTIATGALRIVEETVWMYQDEERVRRVNWHLACGLDVYVEHVNKPEWGRGTIVRERDGKIEIAFESGGTRTFKADAPFLRGPAEVTRYRAGRSPRSPLAGASSE